MYGDEDIETLFEFHAARMRNYMRKQIVEDGWTPKYYSFDNVINSFQAIRVFVGIFY
jgi:hypothetical protein